MVVDLTKTNPEGWENHNFENSINSFSDAIIWEVHVRDFSNKILDSKYRGKYLAFTERGLVNEHGEAVGVDYLVNLGITHVHLLPVYDYATVDEANPDSEFNWGYDPKNYDTPEGSYSTDPFNGEVRIREYKQMVMGLHNAGIAVVMDMVYNHTYSKGHGFCLIDFHHLLHFSKGFAVGTVELKRAVRHPGDAGRIIELPLVRFQKIAFLRGKDDPGIQCDQ